MTTDPGDLVLDPTCGSGTTAYVAEQWGRRWITIDTSRVALALARARIMGARYPYYLLADSREGQRKEAEVDPQSALGVSNLRQRPAGVRLRARAPHYPAGHRQQRGDRRHLGEPLHSRSWSRDREEVEPRARPNRGRSGRYPGLSRNHTETWPDEAKELHAAWWEQRIARQKKIDASIAANADYEYLYDKPYEDRGKVRVAGPFTVESISPHRVLGVDENGDVIDGVAEPKAGYGSGYDFGQVILENLKTSGVQQAHREDRIEFTSLNPWPGRLVCAEGVYVEGDARRTA